VTRGVTPGCIDDGRQSDLRSCHGRSSALTASARQGHRAGRCEAHAGSFGDRAAQVLVLVSHEEQTKRFDARNAEPLKRWKLSDMDLAEHEPYVKCSMAKDTAFQYTDTKQAPWWVVPSDDKKASRLNCINHLLSQFQYENVAPEPVELPAMRDNPLQSLQSSEAPAAPARAQVPPSPPTSQCWQSGPTPAPRCEAPPCTTGSSACGLPPDW
jgi:hypothetical protein